MPNTQGDSNLGTPYLRLTKNVHIAYDGDNAGKSAAIRAGYILLKNGLNPSIVKIIDGMDPDSWVLESGLEPLSQSIEKSTPLIQFSYDNFNNTPENDVVTFINETIDELSNINDNIITEIYLKKLSEITGISFESIKKNFEDKIRKQEKSIELKRSQEKTREIKRNPEN